MTNNFMDWKKPGRALITGASSGIGQEFAEQLAAQGFTPVLVARRKERLEKLAENLKSKYGVTAEVLVADLAKREEGTRLSEKIGAMNDLDVLVNNAGFGTVEKFEKIDLQQQLDMIEVHNTGPVMFTRCALPGMLKRGRGVIIFTSSLSGFLPNPFGGLYSSTKSFLIMLAEMLRLEMYHTDIRIQALCPGFTHTEFHQEEAGLKKLKTSLPGFMFGNTRDVVRKSLAGARRIKTIVIPGMINRLAVRFMPKRMMLSAVESLNLK